MRTIATVEHAVRNVDQLDVLGVEETILQRRVDVVGQRCADTGQALIREHGVRVVQEVAVVVECILRLDASNTNTTADEALDAIVRTEVQKAVQHEAESRRRTTSVIIAVCAGVAADAGRTEHWRSRSRRVAVHGCLTVADFGFEAETAKVVAHYGVDIVTIVMIDRTGIVQCADIIVDVFNDHRTAFDAYVPRLIAGEGGSGECGGGECQNDGKLPHTNPLS